MAESTDASAEFATGRIASISGYRKCLNPHFSLYLDCELFRVVIEAEGLVGADLYEVVKLGAKKLTGEVVKVDGDRATVKQYEGNCKCARTAQTLIFVLFSSS